MSLTRVFKFEAADLAANRQGQISDHQKQLLHDFRESMLRSHWQSGIGISIVMGVGTIIAFVAGNGKLATIGLWVTVMMGGVFIISLLMTNFSSRRLLTSEIRSAEGEAKLTIGNTRGGKAYGVKLGSKQFFVSKAQYEAFRQGQTYRLYYVDGVPYFILSVELL